MNDLLGKVRIAGMNDLLLKGYECLTVILPFLITFVILSLVYKYKKIPHTKGRFLKLAIFTLYIFAVFYFTGAGTIFDLKRYGIRLNAGEINLLPFSKCSIVCTIWVPFAVYLASHKQTKVYCSFRLFFFIID